jgi:hypothetical protein
MLKLGDHDSMNGEHVGTTPGLIVTSGKSSIFPWIYGIFEEVRCGLVC